MILVTGATGFVGSHVSEALLRSGVDALLLSRVARPHYMVADLTNEKSLDQLPWNRITRVIHCAAAIPGRSEDFSEINIEGTRRMLERLPQQNLGSFVLLSSVSVYELDKKASEVEFREANRATSTEPYGRSKLAQENLVREFCKDRIPCAVFRPSSIFGAGNRAKTVLPILCTRARSNEPITLMGPRNFVQNFINVRDVSSLTLRASMEASHGIFNLFSPVTLSMEQLAKRIVTILQSSSAIHDERTDDPYPIVHYNADRLNSAFAHSFETFSTGIRESC